MELFRYKKPIPLMEKAKIFFTISVIAVLASWALIAFKGFNYGIDFAGGTLVQVKYEGKAPLDKVREAIKRSKVFEGASVNYFGSEEEIIIKVLRLKTFDPALPKPLVLTCLQEKAIFGRAPPSVRQTSVPLPTRSVS